MLTTCRGGMRLRRVVHGALITLFRGGFNHLPATTAPKRKAVLYDDDR